MIYFDNGATTFPKPFSVRKAVNDAMSNYGANPGRSGHIMSVKSSEIMFSCRENAAKLFVEKKALSGRGRLQKIRRNSTGLPSAEKLRISGKRQRYSKCYKYRDGSITSSIYEDGYA